MGGEKAAKAAVLVIGAAALGLSFVRPDWDVWGIRSGCPLRARLAYPFLHAGLVHALLNVWCLVSVVFIYRIPCGRLALSYAAAVSVPVNLLSSLHEMTIPTVGLSGAVYFLFASVTFEVRRKAYYQAWMAVYLLAGFLYPHTNAWLHLWCYLLGLLHAILVKPISIRDDGKGR